MHNENLVATIEVTDEEGNVSTRDIVTYAGLLSKAHEQGLQRIETKIEQMPCKDNGMTAICTATVTTTKGVFMDCGDANPGNVRSGAVPHIIRVALTRAKARALRDAVNIGTISLEELGEYPPDSAKPGNSGETAGTSRASVSRAPKPMTEPQRRHLLMLLEKQGKIGADADEYLLRELGVQDLSEATLPQASALIQKLSADNPTKTGSTKSGKGVN